MNAPCRWSLVALVFALSPGCTATRGGVGLYADGMPKAEACSNDALNTMRILRLKVGDWSNVTLDINQDDFSPITLHDGPVESMLISKLGLLPTGTRLYGRVWTEGPQVVVRYYEAHPPDGDKIPICAVARLSKGQMRKLPESKPGTAILEFYSAGVDIVDAFR
jgi:hypothetical protein